MLAPRLIRVGRKFAAPADMGARQEHIGEHHRRAAEDIILQRHTLIHSDIVLDFAAVPDLHIGSDHDVLGRGLQLAPIFEPEKNMREVPDLGGRGRFQRPAIDDGGLVTENNRSCALAVGDAVAEAVAGRPWRETQIAPGTAGVSVSPKAWSSCSCVRPSVSDRNRPADIDVREVRTTDARAAGQIGAAEIGFREVAIAQIRALKKPCREARLP